MLSPFLAGTPVVAKAGQGFLFVEHPNGELRLPRIPGNDWNGIEEATGIPAVGFVQTRCDSARNQPVVSTMVHPTLIRSVGDRAPMPLHVVHAGDERSDVHDGDIGIIVALLNQQA